MLNWLKYKKTYIVCAAAILTAIGTYLGGGMDLGQLVTAIFAAITAMTMRAGITKSGS